MNSRGKKMGLIKRYTTRKQLIKLPAYLLSDIGKTQQDVATELSKNSLITVMKQSFQHLLKVA